MSLIFKVVPKSEWQAAEIAGAYAGSPHDKRDGFIHFSTAQQLAGTLAKHYAGQRGLILIAVDADAAGDMLKWEPARESDLFPHLYGTLPMRAVKWVRPLSLAPDGAHVVPPEAMP